MAAALRVKSAEAAFLLPGTALASVISPQPPERNISLTEAIRDYQFLAPLLTLTSPLWVSIL